MKRLLALIGAVAMVVGAVALRSGGIDPGGGGSGEGGQRPLASFVCATELADVCEALADVDDELTVRVEEPGTTLDRLVRGEVTDDVWLAPRAWMEMAQLADGSALVGEPGEVLARSPIVLVGAAGLPEACPDAESVWRCIGDDPTGLRPGIEGADTTSGLWPRAAAGSAFFGGPFASNDFTAPPEGGGPSFTQWLGALLDEVPGGTAGSPLDTMLRTGGATFDFAASIEAVALPALERSREAERLQVIYPLPMTTVDVTAVAIAGGDSEVADAATQLLVGDEGRDAFAASGWRVEGEALANEFADAPPLPDGNGLPDPGVVVAIRSQFP